MKTNKLKTLLAFMAIILSLQTMHIQAATVDDLVTISSDWTFIADDITTNGTVGLTQNTLYADGRIFSPTGNSVAANKGSVTFAGGTHLNSLRLKNSQNQLAIKVAGPCTIEFYSQSHGSRGLTVGTTVRSGNTGTDEDSGCDEYGQQPVSTSSWSCDITNAGIVYIASHGGDFFFAGFTITFPSEPQGPTYTTVYDIASSLYSADVIIQNTTGTLAATTADEAANAPELQVDATSGKLGKNNASWAQINAVTILTLPGVPEGAEVSFVLYNSTPLTIKGVDYTNGQTYTATASEDLVMTCNSSGYIQSITVVGGAFGAASEPEEPEEPEGYTNTWYFGKSNGAPEFALQKSAEYTYTVSGYSLIVNTDNGKLNNASRTDMWCQCNNGTLFKVPAFEGAKLSWGKYSGGNTTGFTIGGTLYNDYYVATAEEIVNMTATGISYLSQITVEPVTMYEVSGSISGGNIDGSSVYLTSTSNGQAYAATVSEGGFTLKVPAGTYSLALSSEVAFVISTPSSLTVSAAGSVGAITIVSASPQTVTGAIANAPAEAFSLTFTGSNHTETVNCAANATSFTATLSPDTYVMSSSVGTLSTLSQESFTVVSAAVTHNIYFPETVIPATSSAITVDNTLVAESANNYKTINHALQAIKAGSISSPVITLTSGQTYREQVVIDMANVTLKTSGAEKATITFYYGIGYGYYSLNNSGYYDRDRAMTRNSKLEVGPARWGCTVLVNYKGNNFRAENIIFENSFNQYYTDEEVLDGVAPNSIGSAITYDRTLRAGDQGFKAADSRTPTERAAAIAFENNPTGCELYDCEFISSQDTYYTSGSIYNKNCKIQGNTDYIFGGGNVVFDNCDLVIGGYSDQEATAYITANYAGTGEAYILRDCTVKPSNRQYVAANLGRDWGGTGVHVYYFNLKSEMPEGKMHYNWSNMGGAITAGTADLHIYDFDPAVNVNYSTTGSSGANVNGLLSDDDATALYTGVVSRLGFTPEQVYDVALDEDVYYNAIRIKAANGGTGDVTLTRGIAADKWSTIVLPFDLASSRIETVFGEGAVVAELESGDATTLYFTTTLTNGKMAANQPYAIQVASPFSSTTISDVTYADAEPTQTAVGWDFVGTYASANIPEGSYFFSANQLWQAEDDSNTIKPFRAYFTYTGTGIGAPQPRFIIEGENNATDLSNLSNSSNSTKFFENGVLYILREGVIYDAMGRVIK